MSLWSQNPRVLLDAPLEFMYSYEFDSVRNLNAMVRFVIYWSILMYFMTGNPLVFVVMVAVLILMRRPVASESAEITTDDTEADSKLFCQSPSVENPMANPTLVDWGNGQAKLPACPSTSVSSDIEQALKSQPITGQVYKVGGEDINTKLTQRSFYSVPNSGVPDGRDEFVRMLYGDNIGRSIPSPS